MISKPLIILLVFFLALGSLGFALATGIQPPIQTAQTPPTCSTANNTTILVSQSSQDQIVVYNVTVNNTTNPQPRIPNPFEPRQVIKWEQITPSGRIPHIVEATDENNNKVQYYSYCIEPSQKAVSGEGLNEGNAESSAVILKTVRDSNPSDKQSATDAQMKIWVLLSGGSTDTSQGEASSYAAGMTKTQLQSNLNQAKNELMDEYNVSEDQIADLNEYKYIDFTGTSIVSNTKSLVQTIIKRQTKYWNSISNNTTANNTTNKTNQTNITNNSQNTSSNSSSGSDNVSKIIYMVMSILKL